MQSPSKNRDSIPYPIERENVGQFGHEGITSN